MRKNIAGQHVDAVMLSTTDASVLASSVTGYVMGDGGAQTTFGGTLSYKGNGAWQYAPTQAETNYNHIAFLFTHATGIYQLVNVYTLDFTYQAKVGIIDDDGGSQDIYAVSWFRDSTPIYSGITSPLIQVVKVADGADLIAQTAMTAIGATGFYKYTATSGERIVDGAHYIVKVTATIDGAARTWSQPVIGRDS